MFILTMACKERPGIQSSNIRNWEFEAGNGFTLTELNGVEEDLNNKFMIYQLPLGIN